MVNIPGTQLHGPQGVFEERVYHIESGLNNKAINQISRKLIAWI
jgi:hypothetical protein